MREHLRAELVSAALLMAAQRQRPVKGLIIHSAAASTPPSRTARCLRAGACGSRWAARAAALTTRSPPGLFSPGSYGNGLIALRSMESFFHTLKVELVHREHFATREEARRELFAYLEGYYNRQRLHSALGYRTPEQAERLAA